MAAAAGTTVNSRKDIARKVFPVTDYDLAATLTSGQAFRWNAHPEGWEGIIGGRWVRLQAGVDQLSVEAVEPGDWTWVREYLQLDVPLHEITATFPKDEPMKAALKACHGLRLLRQEPWECLASFILSSTKRIAQIRQIVDRLCRRFGEPVACPRERAPMHAFPAAAVLAGCSEAELRQCAMGFRAPYLLETARLVAAHPGRLASIRSLELCDARELLMEYPGVGRKIADCVLLFAGGHPQAFPVDVWILRALQELYFPRRRPTPKQLLAFSETHFGGQGGYAQQYLFHYMRQLRGRVPTG